jgi:hypothetical protein
LTTQVKELTDGNRELSRERQKEKEREGKSKEEMRRR